MKRRATVCLGAGAALGAALPRLGQTQPRMARIGILSSYSPAHAGAASNWAPFYAELVSRGWVEGRNFRIEGRYSEGQAHKDAAASLARPGGNVTGVTNQAGDMQGKFVELLRSIRPDIKRLGAIWSPDNVGSTLAFKDLQAVADSLGMLLLSLPASRPADVEPLLATAQREGVQALIAHPTPAVVPAWRSIQVWALEHKVITLGQAQWVRGGFLMSYWAQTPELFRIAATFVDRLLRGALPAELPVEQPTKFELVINLKTARALGLAIPQALLLRADEVIQ